MIDSLEIDVRVTVQQLLFKLKKKIKILNKKEWRDLSPSAAS